MYVFNNRVPEHGSSSFRLKIKWAVPVKDVKIVESAVDSVYSVHTSKNGTALVRPKSGIITINSKTVQTLVKYVIVYRLRLRGNYRHILF